MRKLLLVILTGLVAVGVFAWSSGTLSVSGSGSVSITYNSSDSTFSFSTSEPSLYISFSDSSENTGYCVSYGLPVGGNLSLDSAYFYQYLFKSDAASLKLTAGKFDIYSAAFKFGLEGNVGDVSLGIAPVLYLKGEEIAFDINNAYVKLSNLGLYTSVAVYDVTAATPSISLYSSIDTSAFSDLKFNGSVSVSAKGGAAPDISYVGVSLSYTYDAYTFSLNLDNNKVGDVFKTALSGSVSYSTELPVIGPVGLTLGLNYDMEVGLKDVSVSASWSKELISHCISVTFYPENPTAGVAKSYAVLGWTGSFSF